MRVTLNTLKVSQSTVGIPNALWRGLAAQLRGHKPRAATGQAERCAERYGKVQGTLGTRYLRQAGARLVNLVQGFKVVQGIALLNRYASSARRRPSAKNFEALRAASRGSRAIF